MDVLPASVGAKVTLAHPWESGLIAPKQHGPIGTHMAAGTNSIFRRELRQSLISCHLLLYTLILTLSRKAASVSPPLKSVQLCDSHARMR